LNVCLYARVSTKDKEQDPERQFIQLRRYCELHSHNIVGEFRDFGVSGDTIPEKRQGFSLLLAEKPDAVVVYSLDRLSRQHPSKVISYLGRLKDRGVLVISVTEPAFNMEGEFAELIQYIITWFNSWYLRNLKKNIKTGLENAVAKGKVLGRSKAKFNKRRAYQLLFVEKKSQRFVSKELGVSLATTNRFKKVCENKGGLFINEGDVTQSDDFVTRKEMKK